MFGEVPFVEFLGMLVRSIIRDAVITGGRKWFGACAVKELDIENSKFVGCQFGYNKGMIHGRRDSVTDVFVSNCSVTRCNLGVAEVRRCIFQSIVGDCLISFGSVFDQVVVRGVFPKLMLHGVPAPISPRHGSAQHVKYANDFYQNVSWAIDISEAQFEEFSMRTGAVPLHLVRIDNETQVIIKILPNEVRRAAERLGLSEYTSMIINLMKDEGQSSTLLVAPKRNKDVFEIVMRDIYILRSIDAVT